MARIRRSKARRWQTLNSRSVPSAVQAARERSKRNTFRDERLARSWHGRIPNRLQIGGHLPRQHLDKARAVHADGLALIGDVLKRDRLPTFIERALGKASVASIEGNEIESLTQHEYFRGAVA